MICNICFDEDTNLLTTPCNHTYHPDCIKRIIYPKCPLCKSDILKTLNLVGVSTKKVNKNICAENYRIFLSHINYYDDIDKNDLFQLSIKAKILNNTICFDKYKDIVMAFINNISNKLLNLSNLLFANNSKGLFLYYCDVSNFILNMNNNYDKSILAWKSEIDLLENNIFVSPSKKLLKEIDDKHFGLLIIFYDDLRKKNIIFPLLVNTNNLTNKLPSLNDIHKTLCEFDTLQLSSTYRENIELDFANRMDNYFYKLFNDIPNDTYNYRFLNLFMEKEFDKIITTNCDGILQFSFINDYTNDYMNYNYTFMYKISKQEDKLVYKYIDDKNGNVVKITCSNISYFLMRYFKKYKNSFVKLTITEKHETKLIIYDIDYDDDTTELIIEKKDPYEAELQYTNLLTDKKSLNIKVKFI
jgi:hypothetical protein